MPTFDTCDCHASVREKGLNFLKFARNRAARMLTEEFCKIDMEGSTYIFVHLEMSLHLSSPFTNMYTCNTKSRWRGAKGKMSYHVPTVCPPKAETTRVSKTAIQETKFSEQQMCHRMSV